MLRHQSLWDLLSFAFIPWGKKKKKAKKQWKAIKIQIILQIIDNPVV